MLQAARAKHSLWQPAAMGMGLLSRAAAALHSYIPTVVALAGHAVSRSGWQTFRHNDCDLSSTRACQTHAYLDHKHMFQTVNTYSAICR